jgi:hypothetical protein
MRNAQGEQMPLIEERNATSAAEKSRSVGIFSNIAAQSASVSRDTRFSDGCLHRTCGP